MKSKLMPVLVLGLVLLGAAAAWADGDIYAGGPWGTRITSLPYTINASGSYYLGASLTFTGAGAGITINKDDVTLDLMGYSLTNTASSGTSYGIYSTNSNVEVRNGTVSGCDSGIYLGGDSNRVINVRAVGNTNAIWLGNYGGLVQGCEAEATGTGNAIYIGISATVSDCTIKFDTGYGLNGWQGLTSGNRVIGSSNAGVGIWSSAAGSIVLNNEVSGCATGILCGSGAIIIGNTVTTASGTTGIALTDNNTNLVDQNTVLGSGTPWLPATRTNTYARTNYPAY